MTDDIVTRLRQNLFHIQEGCGEFACEYLDTDLTDKDLLEAADEIEQLRQKEFMWKMSCVRIATKFMPLSLLLSKEEKEELQIIITEAVNG